MMLRALKLAVATHLLMWSLCHGMPKGVSGEEHMLCVCWVREHQVSGAAYGVMARVVCAGCGRRDDRG